MSEDRPTLSTLEAIRILGYRKPVGGSTILRRIGLVPVSGGMSGLRWDAAAVAIAAVKPPGRGGRGVGRRRDDAPLQVACGP